MRAYELPPIAAYLQQLSPETRTLKDCKTEHVGKSTTKTRKAGVSRLVLYNRPPDFVYRQ